MFPEKIEPLNDEIHKNLDEFLSLSDQIKHLIGICRITEGREFLFKKIDKCEKALINIVDLISEQFE